MGILLCEQNCRHVWIRNKSVRAEIGQILRTHKHTHTTAAKLVVRTSKEPVCPRVELILKIIIILLIIFLGFIKSKPC